MTDPVQLYIKELKNSNSNKEESLELLRKARQGDEVAKEVLLKNYLLFVVKIAREYMNMGVPLGDLIAEGNVGLIKAVDKYKLEKNTPFSTVAHQWIKQSIIRNCMHNKRIVRIPENQSELIRQDRWNKPSHKEFSIDAQNEEGDSMAEKVADEGAALPFANENSEILKRKIAKILSVLKKRDSEIVKDWFGIGTPDDEPVEIEEVASKFGLTTTRVTQIVRSSISKLREESYEDFKSVTIVQAKYGEGDSWIDVTEKVVMGIEQKQIVRSSNKLGGDPSPNSKKHLVVNYYSGGEELLTKMFSEYSVVKF